MGIGRIKYQSVIDQTPRDSYIYPLGSGIGSAGESSGDEFVADNGSASLNEIVKGGERAVASQGEVPMPGFGIFKKYS